MPVVILDGIETHYSVSGGGPPLLLFSPGGFNGSMANWETQGIYSRLNLLDHLSAEFTCVTFDKRESGSSGGRVEAISWDAYAKQGIGLLDHLGIQQAHLFGGCVGCSIVTTVAAIRPHAALSMVLFSPAGGARYRVAQQERLSRHLAFVAANGLDGVVMEAARTDATYSSDPHLGPWVSVLRRDGKFARDYVRLDPAAYVGTVRDLAANLFSRDSVPGPDAEQLFSTDVPALVVPGQDASHATSAARFLEECLPRSEYWDVPVSEQSEAAVAARLLAFLGSI